jgi:hypothetical protein
MLGNTNLTVETTCDHLVLLKICKDTPFRRDTPGGPVGVAKIGTKAENLE